MRETELKDLVPDEHDDIALRAVSGTWGRPVPSGPGSVQLQAEALRVVSKSSGEIIIRYGELTGGSWHTGRITLHGDPGTLVLEADRGLDRAWASLVAAACPIPEFTRGLRTLGSRRAGSHEGHVRYFAPLLHARRRMEDERDLQHRLAAFDARSLRDRLLQILDSLAREAHPEQPPERRALEAELLDANETLLAALDSLKAAAERFHRSNEELRFAHWRAWVAGVGEVFAHADRSWEAMTGILPASPLPRPQPGPGR